MRDLSDYFPSAFLEGDKVTDAQKGTLEREKSFCSGQLAQVGGGMRGAIVCCLFVSQIEALQNWGKLNADVSE